MFIFEKAPFASCHASTLVEVAPGRLLAAWFGGKAEGAKDVKVWSSAFDGKKWSAPAGLAPGPGLLGPIKNKPVEVRPGVILAGTSVESYRAWCAWVERSADDGRTWKRFGPIAVPGKPYGLIQPTLLATRAGGVLALCRSRGIGFICRAESKDGGG